MRYASFPFVLGAVVSVLAAVRAAPINDFPAPIVTRQTVFSIPFNVPVVNVADQPAEVRLLTSADRGATWQVTDRVDMRAQRLPYKGGFVFRAPSDGEYWFAIRTVDRAGQMKPERTSGPELRVVVDTRSPQLHPQSQVNGQNFATSSPRGAKEAPLTASMNRGTNNGAAGSGAGGFAQSTQWPADARTDLPLGRGNGASKQPMIRMPDDPSGLLAPARANDVGPIEGPALSPPADGRLRPSGQPWDREMTRAVESRINPPIGNQYTRQADEFPATTDSAGTPLDNRPTAAAAPAASGRSPIFFDRGGRGAVAGDDLSSPRMTRASGLDYVIPPGEQLRMVNSTTFELDYDVESVGRSGIARIELWVTRDGGRTWNSMGVDSDNRSPFRATVDGEGVYGFRMTVQSGSGLSGRAPRAGDLPDVWIGVDLSRPEARLISAEPGAGDRAGEMIIRYEASDALLAKRPITLSRSGQPGGPWTTIAAGLDNSGQYSWRFDNTAPDRVYLRLEVRDEAGNIGAFE
ncbi:MAG TPA: hypothetical protein VJ809_01485, partial [Pirellulales bacterium]|nr:hypothetical protein [Pirellulales bacterium]